MYKRYAPTVVTFYWQASVDTSSRNREELLTTWTVCCRHGASMLDGSTVGWQKKRVTESWSLLLCGVLP